MLAKKFKILIQSSLTIYIVNSSEKRGYQTQPRRGLEEISGALPRGRKGDGILTHSFADVIQIFSDVERSPKASMILYVEYIQRIPSQTLSHTHTIFTQYIHNLNLTHTNKSLTNIHSHYYMASPSQRQSLRLHEWVGEWGRVQELSRRARKWNWMMGLRHLLEIKILSC